jgi:inner membrane protein
VLLAVAVLTRQRPAWSLLSAGLALGVLLHFVRDMAIPPGVGVSILWPMSDRPWRISENAYGATLALLVVLGCLRPAPTSAAGRT